MKKILTLIVAMITVAVVAAEKLPAELAKVPKAMIIDLSANIHGKIIKADKDAPAGKAAVQIPSARQKKSFWNAGVFCPAYHKKTKKVISYKEWTSFPKDEKYHWYKLPWCSDAKGMIAGNATIYNGNWSSGCSLKPHKGVYEYWAAFKFQGPFFVPGSKKENGVYLGGAILVKKD